MVERFSLRLPECHQRKESSSNKTLILPSTMNAAQGIMGGTC
jgi:hypothetical protein